MQERAPHIETIDREYVEQVAIIAEQLARDFIFPHNIWRAMSHITENRDELFYAVRDELKRRKRGKRAAQIAKPDRIELDLRAQRKAEFMRDAWRNQHSQPTDAWNPRANDYEGTLDED